MIHILFAMTPGITLDKWERMGIIDREILPYKYHIKSGNCVTILECNRKLKKPMRYYKNINIIRLPHWRAVNFTTNLFKYIYDIDLIKTNQTYKAEIFVELAKKIKKPILLRCGYVRGEFYETIYGLVEEVKKMQKDESWAFQNCTMASVPTSYLKEWVCDRYNVKRKKIVVNPNFVNIKNFRPLKKKIRKKTFRICTVGRLVDVKRIDMLIKACSGINDIELEIIGEGPEKENIQSLANENQVPIRFHGRVNNDNLPDILQSCDTFVICSKWEGHPKALIEAMATGLPCIGTDNVGINNILNNQNGLLVSTSINSLRGGVKRLLNDRYLCYELGKEARKYVVNKYSLSEFLRKDQLTINTAIKNYYEF